MTEDGYILPSHEELSGLLEKNLIEEHKRAESEWQRAESEKQKAEQAEKKAEQERQRAEQAEQRAALLADKLKQIGISVE
jgi:hypothetical protein